MFAASVAVIAFMLVITFFAGRSSISQKNALPSVIANGQYPSWIYGKWATDWLPSSDRRVHIDLLTPYVFSAYYEYREHGRGHTFPRSSKVEGSVFLVGDQYADLVPAMRSIDQGIGPPPEFMRPLRIRIVSGKLHVPGSEGDFHLTRSESENDGR